jgi:uncharacterized membrane protein
MFYSPLSFLFIILFFAIIIFFFAAMQINVIAVAFEKIGIPSHYVMSALMASFLGSLINIPLKKIPQETMTDRKTTTFFGFRYVIPETQRDYTILAVNVGGAIIPFCISVYLLLKTGLYLQSMIAAACVTLAAYRMAKPIPGVGIALPFFLTPVLAAVISVIITYNNAPVVAYISGSLGTLIGADILNLNKISHLGAPIASIGGAGTFDGVFLSGILAVILSTILA